MLIDLFEQGPEAPSFQTLPCPNLVEPPPTEFLESGIVGPTGAKGDKGDKGDPGDKGDKGDTGDSGSSGVTFHYAQLVPSDFWIVDHTMNKYPSVSVFASSGDEIEGDISYLSNTRITIAFSAPTGGDVYLN